MQTWQANGKRRQVEPPFALEELPDRLKIPIANDTVGGSAYPRQKFHRTLKSLIAVAGSLQAIFRIIEITLRRRKELNAKVGTAADTWWPQTWLLISQDQFLQYNVLSY